MERTTSLDPDGPRTEKRYLRLAAIAAIPCVLAGMYRFGLRVPAMLAVAWAIGAAAEYATDLLRRRTSPKTFLTFGLLFVLILPPGIPLWMVAVGMLFVILIGKEVFGGSGCYLLSPPLLGLSFLMLSYPVIMTGSYLLPGEGLWGMAGRYVDPSVAGALVRETPLTLARQGVATPVDKLLWGGTPGCIGEGVTSAVLIGGAFLLLMRAIDWRTVSGMLGAFLLMEVLLSPFPGRAGVPTGWNMLAGGLLFGAFFLAPDPATAPATRLGRLVFGALVGAGALLLRRFSATPDDVGVAILLGNILVPFVNLLMKRRGGLDAQPAEG